MGASLLWRSCGWRSARAWAVRSARFGHRGKGVGSRGAAATQRDLGGIGGAYSHLSSPSGRRSSPTPSPTPVTFTPAVGDFVPRAAASLSLDAGNPTSLAKRRESRSPVRRDRELAVAQLEADRAVVVGAQDAIRAGLQGAQGRGRRVAVGVVAADLDDRRAGTEDVQERR